MEAFEKLEVWKRSCRLSVELYKQFRDCRDFGFRDQITRSGLSVPSNIAEGYERNSRKEYLRFLKIAKGSSGELRTQLYIGREAGLFPNEVFESFHQEAIVISRLLQGIITKLQE